MFKTTNAYLTVVVLVCLIFLSSLTTNGRAQGIALESLEPRGAQRGTTFKVKLTGERLNLAEQMLVYKPGLELVGLRVIDEESAEATLRAQPDAPLGEHPLMFWGPKGVSKLATMHLGPFQVLAEEEPNNTATSAYRSSENSLAEGVTFVGELEGADVDCFRFELSPGERLSAEIEAMRLGGQFLDAYLDVLDPEGKVVASCDDTALLKQDPMLSLLADTQGSYTLRVREAAFDAEFGSRYRLHVGNFARPTTSYPCGGPAGEQTEVVMLGDAAGEFASTIDVPRAATGFFLKHLNDGKREAAPGPIRFRISNLQNLLEAEPNNSASDSNDSESALVAFNGVLSEPGDQDFFSFEANAGEQYDVEVFASRVGSPLDSVLEIFASDGRSVGVNDDGIVHDSSLRFIAPESGRYFLKVSDHLGRGGPTFVYRVEFQPVEPSLEVRIADLDSLRPNSLPTISLARNNRFAVLASARRKNFAGEVQLIADALPSGVRLSVDQVGADSHLAMLLFEAEPGADLGTQLIDILAYAHTESGTIEGKLRQNVGLVFGEPRQTIYHATELSQLPMAITEDVPFSIVVEQPQAALAQDGLQELRVIANRQEGFNQPIELTALLLPKWIETSEDAAVIKADDESGLFPLISNAQAEPGTYPMILIGKANVDGGEVTVASQRFEVHVAKPHAAIRIASSTTEQGSKSAIDCDIEWASQPEGEAVATLRGLPNHSSSPSVRVNSETKSFTFPVEVGLETPASIHNTLYVELSVPEAGEPNRQYLGRGGTLEVFPQGESASEKRSRLEILRQRSRSIRMTRNVPVP